MRTHSLLCSNLYARGNKDEDKMVFVLGTHSIMIKLETYWEINSCNIVNLFIQNSSLELSEWKLTGIKSGK